MPLLFIFKCIINQITFKYGLDASFALLKMRNPGVIKHFLTYQMSKDLMNF